MRHYTQQTIKHRVTGCQLRKLDIFIRLVALSIHRPRAAYDCRNIQVGCEISGLGAKGDFCCAGNAGQFLCLAHHFAVGVRIKSGIGKPCLNINLRNRKLRLMGVTDLLRGRLNAGQNIIRVIRSQMAEFKIDYGFFRHNIQRQPARYFGHMNGGIWYPVVGILRTVFSIIIL